MGNLDRDHQQVLRALQNEGWHIVKERLGLRWGVFSGEVDIVARLGPEGDPDTRIMVVEVKSFWPRMRMSDIEKAVGQYLIYRSWLARLRPGWVIYMALSVKNARRFDEDPLQAVVQDYNLQIVTVDIDAERIVSWQ